MRTALIGIVVLLVIAIAYLAHRTQIEELRGSAATIERELAKLRHEQQQQKQQQALKNNKPLSRRQQARLDEALASNSAVKVKQDRQITQFVQKRVPTGGGKRGRGATKTLPSVDFSVAFLGASWTVVAADSSSSTSSSSSEQQEIVSVPRQLSSSSSAAAAVEASDAAILKHSPSWRRKMRQRSNNVARFNFAPMVQCLEQVRRMIANTTEASALWSVPSDDTQAGVGENNNNNDTSTALQFHRTILNNWFKLQHLYSLDAARFRAFTHCLKGGGASGYSEKQEVAPAVAQEGWAKRGGGLEKHPWFFALHGGVSPKRATHQGIRSAQYLGIPALALWNNRVIDAPAADHASEIAAWRKILGESTIDDLAVNTRRVFEALDSSRSSNKNENDKNENGDGRRRRITSVFDSLFFNGNDNDNDSSNSKEDRPKVIVDLGCGHGALLAAMCPPHPKLWCYGVDYSSGLISQGTRFFKHLDLRPGVTAPHVATGTADAVLSNAVLPMIHFDQVCDSLMEMIRVMRPGVGTAIIWQPSPSKWGRFAPSFFVDDFHYFLGEDSRQRGFIPRFGPVNLTVRHGRQQQQQPQPASSQDPSEEQEQQDPDSHQRFTTADKVLSRCPGRLGRFISRVEIVADDNNLPIYTPRFSLDYRSVSGWGGEFGVRLFRSNVPFSQLYDQATGFFDSHVPVVPRNASVPGGRDDTTSGFQAPRGLTNCLLDPASWRACRQVLRREFTAALACSSLEKHRGGWCVDTQLELARQRLRSN